MGDVAEGVATDVDAEARAQQELLAELPLASFDGLPEDMLCCVCQQPNLDNVACCASGHNACRECADKLTNGRCPQNCGPLVRPNGNWMRNVPLNSLVRETHLACGHDGCDAKIKLREIKGHMKLCEYRPVACPCAGLADGLGCDWKGPACALTAHMRETDHGKYATSLALTHQRQLLTLHARFDEMDSRFSAMLERDATLRVHEQQRDQAMEELKTTLGVIKDHTNKKDGSSKRSIARHKQMATQIEGFDDERKGWDTERAELKEKAHEEAEAQRTKHDENVAILAAQKLEHTQQLEAKLLELDQARKERDHARTEHENISKSRKRALDSNDQLQREQRNANRRIHEMHLIIQRVSPRETSRDCPCAACTR
jgi:hypothetical protein